MLIYVGDLKQPYINYHKARLIFINIIICNYDEPVQLVYEYYSNECSHGNLSSPF